MDGAISPEMRRRERSLALSVLADSILCVAYGVVSVGSGSISMLAETLRGGILIALGWWILMVLRQVHRQHLTEYDYGAGKLERFGNFLIGLLMILGAIWTLARTFASYAAGPLPPSPDLTLWMRAAQALTVLNVLINAGALLALWRAARDGASLIMRGQVQARTGKLLTSLLVLAAVWVAGTWPGTRLGWISDMAGGLLVVAVMLATGVTLLRESLPDLFDRTLSENLQMAITASLGSHFHRYDTLERVRSRRSGQRLYIEILLGFSPGRSFGEVAQVAKDLARELEAMIPGAEVTVVPVVPGG